MKDLINNLQEDLNQKPSQELQLQQKKQVEYELQGVILPEKGHTVFEIEIKTGFIKPAEYKKEKTVYLFDKNKCSKLLIRKGCVYIPALNKQNALKKFKKSCDQKSYYTDVSKFEKL